MKRLLNSTSLLNPGNANPIYIEQRKAFIRGALGQFFSAYGCNFPRVLLYAHTRTSFLLRSPKWLALFAVIIVLVIDAISSKALRDKSREARAACFAEYSYLPNIKYTRISGRFI